MSNEAKVELPKYRSHKEVWALKIKEIRWDLDYAIEEGRDSDGSAVLHFEEGQVYAPMKVSGEFASKHKPRSGGYYVRYEDGYESWSPAEAFEGGYTKL